MKLIFPTDFKYLKYVVFDKKIYCSNYCSPICMAFFPGKLIVLSKHIYRPQTKFAKVMFLQVFVCPHRGRGHVWLLLGGMRGCSGEACMVAPGGACVVAPGGVHGCCGGHASCSGGACVVAPGGHAWDTMRYGDMINERVVCILLECILVYYVNRVLCHLNARVTLIL